MGPAGMGSLRRSPAFSSQTDDRVRSLRQPIDGGQLAAAASKSASGEEIPWILIQQSRPKAVAAPDGKLARCPLSPPFLLPGRPAGGAARNPLSLARFCLGEQALRQLGTVWSNF